MSAKIASGIPGLDRLTAGGIPEGRSTLISGRSGAGKSIMALQIATQLMRQGLPVIYITAEERPSDIAATGDALGFATSAALKAQGGLRMLDVRSPTPGPPVITGEYDMAGLIARLAGAVREHAARAVVLDSLTALLQPQPAEKILRAQCAYLIGALEGLDLTVVITAAAPADYSRPTLLGVEDYVCDLVLILRNVVEGKRRRRSVEVHKYRRSLHFKGEYPLSITNTGLAVFPTEAPARAEEDARTGPLRFSSGFEGLDGLNGGGWLSQSIILVRGPSGSGRTIFAGMHARASALRGERVEYLGFEETPELLLRNLAEVGIELGAFEARGNLTLRCHPPDAMSMEDLLVELRQSCEVSRPSLLVLDGLECLEAATTPESFRVFVVGVKAIVRELRANAVLTYTPGGSASTSQAVVESTADAIVELEHSVENGTARRRLRLLKMRGSLHAADAHLVEIVQGGFALVSPPGGFLP